MALWLNLRRVGAVVGASVLAFGAPAFAQGLAAVPMTMTPIYMNTTIGLIGIDAARRSTELAYGRPSPTRPAPPRVGPGPARPPAQPAAPTPARFDFGRDPAASQQVKAQFERLVRTKAAPGAAPAVLGFFARKPLRTAYLEAATPAGLGDRDLRDVATAYLVAGWMVANQTTSPTNVQIQGVRRQVARAMEANPPAATPTQRQIMAEQMMYDLVLIVAAHTEGVQARNTAGLASLANETAAAYRQRGFDPRRFTVTNDGFQPR